MILLIISLAVAGALTRYGLDRLLRRCAVEAGYPMARYVASRRRWALAAACTLIFIASAHLFAPAAAVCMSLFLVALLGASCIDADHMIIPDLFTIGLAMLGLLLSALVPALHHCGPWNAWDCLRSAAAGVLGLAIGSALVLWFGLVGEFFLSKEVMGFGDVKFVGAIGAFCGWQGAVFSVFGGAAIALCLIISRKVASGWSATSGRAGQPWGISNAPGLPSVALAKEGGRVPPHIAGGAEFAFGPMLAAAAALYALGLHMPVDAYLAQYRALF